MNLRKNGLRAFGLCVVAALGLMAFSAAGAQAAGEFFIKEGASLKSFAVHGITEENVEGKVDVLGELTVAGLGIVIGCDKFDLKETKVKVGGFALGKVLFLECAVLDLEKKLLSKCGAQDSVSKVAKDIGTELVLGTVLLHPETTGEPYVLFTPDAKLNGLFATVELTGAECAAKGTYPVEGSTVFLIKEGEAEWALIKAAPESLFPNDKLKFGERKAVISGAGEIRLTGALAGKEWGAL